jgi:PAS domain S-box-containing protein
MEATGTPERRQPRASGRTPRPGDRPADPRLADQVWLDALFQASRDAILLIDPRGGIVWTNPAAESLFGYSAAELLGTPAENLLSAAWRPAVPAWHQEFATTGRVPVLDTPAPVELVIRRKSGEERWVEFTTSPPLQSSGGRRVLLAIVRDVTERKQAAAALQASEARFRALVERAYDWIVLLDTGGRIQYASPSIEQTLGYVAATRVGQPALQLVHPEDRPHTEAVLADLLRDPVATARVEVRCRHADGSWRTIEAVARNLLAEPSVGAIVINARDVTEQVHLRTRREALLRVARRLALEAEPEQVMRSLLAEAVDLTGGSFGLVACWDETRQVLCPVWSTLPMRRDPVDVRLGEGAGGQAAARREPVIINDYQDAPGTVASARQAGLRAMISAPLLHEARLLGVVTVASDAPGQHFDQEDAALLELLASLAAAVLVGLERSRLEGALLAARTAQHALNNQLALTVGYADLLAADPRLPPELREMAGEALSGAQAAAATLEQLQCITRLEEIDQAGPGPVLDLARSAQRAS